MGCRGSPGGQTEEVLRVLPEIRYSSTRAASSGTFILEVSWELRRCYVMLYSKMRASKNNADDRCPCLEKAFLKRRRTHAASIYDPNCLHAHLQR